MLTVLWLPVLKLFDEDILLPIVLEHNHLGPYIGGPVGISEKAM